MRFNAVLVLAAASLTLASPAPHPGHVVHEKRSGPAGGWEKRDRMNPNTKLPFRIGLRQRNLHRAEEFMDEVSNPMSEKFGQHWSASDIVNMFAPSDESISAVKAWLEDSGIDSSRITVTSTKSWITLDLTVFEAERLLQTEYHVYEHSTGQPHFAAESYSLPAHLSKDHIDLIMPTVHFDVKLPSRDQELRKRDRETRAATKRQTNGTTSGIAKALGQPSNNDKVKFGTWLNPQQIITELQHCDTQIVPDCLRALYKFTPNVFAAKGNSYGIVEYTPQAYVPTDLDLFFSNFSTGQVGERPILASIDGGVVQNIVESFGFNGESDLDLQYAMVLVGKQPVTLFQVGDLVEGASFNNFLDGIDASYCTFMGGDDPNQDGIYPDPLGGGFTGPADCGKFAPPAVVSTSYGYNEADLTLAYEKRQCLEYMKLGLAGTTVLYSSGDFGVAGNGGFCLGPNNTMVQGSGKFSPSFPGVCQWVTSVGATQVTPGTNIIQAIAAKTQPEMACETVIFSGGGFSNNFAIPDYQKAAVAGYLQNTPPPYTAAQFNNSGMSRGLPDVSANGANYVVAVDGKFALVFGTSASSPTFGSVVTLINEARMAIGKSSVGFMNPVLYANPQILNDVTNGTNPGCGTKGFSAAKGWDPVTGLGTPDFPAMLQKYLQLP